MSIKFVNPPPPKSDRIDWRQVAAELRANPGAWALVAEGGSSPATAVRIRKGEAAGMAPAGSFEATTRRVEGNKFDTYARFVGDSGDDR